MVLATYILAVLLFSLTFYFSKIVKTCVTVLTIASQALETITNQHISDQQKQNEVQHAAAHMLKAFLLLILKISLVLSAILLPAFIADQIRLVPIEESSKFSLRGDVLIITTIIALVLWTVWSKFFSPTKENSPEKKDSNAIPYSGMERVIHNIAFGSHLLQKTLISFEKRLYAKQWQAATAEKPIFVTSLPRAGTTIVLEALTRLPNLASHTYRDMPFIFTPVLWNKLSSRFQKQSALHERAHGDGLQINEDSPEAFEEVLWTKFYPQKYASDHIKLWLKSDNNFSSFFHDYIKKIIYLRHSKALPQGRYLSKNNANIARIPAIKEMYPDAIILIPLRDPIEHAISLYRQHQNFSQQHKAEPFIKKYMADIGHFEFGELHKPIQFPGFEALRADLNPESPNYWLAYWIAAFDYLATLEGVQFLAYEKFCTEGEAGLAKLCENLGIEANSEMIEKAASILRPAPSRQQNYHFSADLSQQALSLHQSLLAKAQINH